ncbi:MAG: 6-carboxytetrahydropterin synthase QueD [Desulfomonile sp.]|nr:6-carboxytetrahydropterin synthase QueD [Desulfomonile sp.]
MYEVEIVTSFSAAHSLRDYNGKCERLHGHNYKIHVAARSSSTGRGGMVIDFTELKQATSSVIDRFDHRYLNEVSPFDTIEPSAEHIAKVVFQSLEQELGASGAMLHSVSVWESDSSRATYFRDADG